MKDGHRRCLTRSTEEIEEVILVLPMPALPQRTVVCLADVQEAVRPRVEIAVQTERSLPERIALRPQVRPLDDNGKYVVRRASPFVAA